MDMAKQTLDLELIRAKLHARLGGRGIDVEKVFVTTIVVHDQGKEVVSSSDSLPMFFLQHLREGRAPIVGAGVNLYVQQYSLDENHRFHAVTVDELNSMAVSIARDVLDN